MNSERFGTTLSRGELTDELVQLIATDLAAEPVEELTPDTDLVLSGLVDSLGVVQIVEWLERRLDVEIDPADVVIEHFSSVTAMIEYLDTRDDTSLRTHS